MEFSYEQILEWIKEAIGLGKDPAEFVEKKSGGEVDLADTAEEMALKSPDMLEQVSSSFSAHGVSMNGICSSSRGGYSGVQHKTAQHQQDVHNTINEGDTIVNLLTQNNEFDNSVDVDQNILNLGGNIEQEFGSNVAAGDGAVAIDGDVEDAVVGNDNQALVGDNNQAAFGEGDVNNVDAQGAQNVNVGEGNTIDNSVEDNDGVEINDNDLIDDKDLVDDKDLLDVDDNDGFDFDDQDLLDVDDNDGADIDDQDLLDLDAAPAVPPPLPADVDMPA